MAEYLIYWPTLTRGTLIRRYKRFMADVELENGTIITAHCPNSGRMLGCAEPGRAVFLSFSDNKSRTYPYTWEIIDMPGSPVVVNTLRANHATREAVRRDVIPELSGYTSIRPEVKVDHSRIDLLLTGAGKQPALVEVKSCTYAEDGRVMFPDAVTARGLKHLKELSRSLGEGYRCVMFFLVQRMDARIFAPADHIDPAYSAELRRACKAGVEILVYDIKIDHEGIAPGNKLTCLI
jgi:sugar fermentation stimulation protein A